MGMTAESQTKDGMDSNGGGVSKKHEKFIPRLTVQAEVVAAATLNEAGIIGAALAAAANHSTD